MVVGVDGARDVPEELGAPRTAGGSETCCDAVFFFIGGDSWPESESVESESVLDRFLDALEDADEDDADDPDEEDEEVDDPDEDEEVDESDNVLWMGIGDGTGGDFVFFKIGIVKLFGVGGDGSVPASSRISCGFGDGSVKASS